MPNRILKESICYSESIDELSWFEEVVFYRLIVRCDDYGRIDGRIPFLKSMLFVTKPGVTEKSIEEAVSQLAKRGLVRRYDVVGKPYMVLPKWTLHQRIRNSVPKYPPPQDAENGGGGQQETTERDGSRQVAASCGEMPQDAASGGLNPNPNPNPKNTTASRVRARGEGESAALYCEQNLMSLSSGNWEDLREFMAQGITDELVKYAVDDACAQGKRTWGYVRTILNGYMCDGVKTIGEAKARADKRKNAEKKAKAQESRRNANEPPPPIFFDD